MQNCTIYSHKLDFDHVTNIVKEELPKAKIEIKDNGIHKSLVATIKGGFLSKNKSLKINYRQRQHPSYKLDRIDCPLTQNLQGMIGFVQSIDTPHEEIKNKFLIKVMATNCEMAFMAEPDINYDFERVLRKIVLDLDAFIFSQPNHVFNTTEQQHFTDKNLDLILDTDGNCEIDDIEVSVDTKYHDEPAAEYTDEQIERKSRSENSLNERSVKINTNLPCTPSSEDAKMRKLEEVIHRAYALLIIAVKGEGIEQEHLERTVQEKSINGFSPGELQVYQATSLNDQERANAAWRYESLYVILWALNKMENLKYPDEICDVQAVVASIFKPSRTDFEASATMRSKTEILDELDKTFRMHWACVDARLKEQTPSGNLNPSVIYERHYALNWLTGYMNQDWDNVQTNT